MVKHQKVTVTDEGRKLSEVPSKCLLEVLTDGSNVTSGLEYPTKEI
jgi:hypothetical protein